MDGPVLFIKGWFFTLALVWFYRRFFQTVGPRVAEFEAFCRKGQTLAALSVTPGSEASVLERVRAALGKRSEVVATLGGWPWTYHALKVRLVASTGSVLVEIVSCRVLRTAEKHPPALTELLLSVLGASPASVRSSWLHPGAYVPVVDATETSGWQLAPESPKRRRLEPWLVRPQWLDAALNAASSAPKCAAIGGSRIARARAWALVGGTFPR